MLLKKILEKKFLKKEKFHCLTKVGSMFRIIKALKIVVYVSKRD
jgi:hypothetical protein